MGSPPIADRVCAGNTDGRLFILDFATGDQLAEFHAGGAVMGSPAIAGGGIVFDT